MNWAGLASHGVIAVLVIVFGLIHRHDLKRIVIEFKNGKDKDEGTK